MNRVTDISQNQAEEIKVAFWVAEMRVKGMP